MAFKPKQIIIELHKTRSRSGNCGCALMLKAQCRCIDDCRMDLHRTYCQQ